MPDLSVTNLTKSFPTPTEPLVVLDHVSMKLEMGENLAVIGPSGSGKSTFLHVVGTLDSPTSGEVSLFGENPFELGEKQLARFRNENIGFVFQEHHLLPQLSALENVLVPAVANGRASQSDKTRAVQLLDQVGLPDRASHLPSELSGGERQRVAVARALLHKPRLILADEPTGSLDRKNAEQIATLLLDLQSQENAMLICVTHNEELAGQFQRRMRVQDASLTEANTG